MREPIGIIEKSENTVLAIRRMSDRSDLELNESRTGAFLDSPPKREFML